MATSLIDQLAEQLDLAPGDAQQALADLSAHLQEQLDGTGEASLPGLGVFRTGPDGLRFEPNQALALSVNQRYAGLKPVTVGADPSGSFRKQQVVEPASKTAPPDEADSAETAAEPDTEPPPLPEVPAAQDLPEAPAPEETPDSDDETLEDDLDALLDDELGEEEETWQPPEPSDADHPLGPMPKPTFEEADFSVLADFEETRQAAEAAEAAAPSEPAANASEVADDSEESLAGAEESYPEETLDAAPEDAPPSSEPEDRSGVAAVRLPVEGAPAADFEDEEPVVEKLEADEETAPADAVKDASPFFEEWEPADFEGEETLEDDLTSETGDLADPDASDVSDPDPSEAEEPAPVMVPPATTPKPTQVESAGPAARPVRRPPRERETERSWLPLILGGAAVVIIAALLYVFLFRSAPEEPAITPPIAQQDPTPQPSTTDPPSATDPTSTEDPASSSGTTTEGGPASPSSTSTDLETIDRNAGVWTLVVASWTVRESADQELERYAQQFRSSGYPVDLLTETSNNVTRYRVAVGSFPTQAAAAEARETLGDDIPDGTWLLRVRPDM